MALAKFQAVETELKQLQLGQLKVMIVSMLNPAKRLSYCSVASACLKSVQVPYVATKQETTHLTVSNLTCLNTLDSSLSDDQG